MVDYNKRLVEVDEILNYLSDEDLEKIPDDIKQAIRDNKDKDYTWNYNEDKPLKEQDVSRDTIAILSYLNMEYLLNEKQKQFMEEMHKRNEQEKRKKEYSNETQYNYEDLFKRKNKVEDTNNEQEEVALIPVKEETFISRIINKIKSFFNLNRN